MGTLEEMPQPERAIFFDVWTCSTSAKDKAQILCTYSRLVAVAFELLQASIADNFFWVAVPALCICRNSISGNALGGGWSVCSSGIVAVSIVAAGSRCLRNHRFPAS